MGYENPNQSNPYGMSPRGNAQNQEYHQNTANTAMNNYNLQHGAQSRLHEG